MSSNSCYFDADCQDKKIVISFLQYSKEERSKAFQLYIGLRLLSFLLVETGFENRDDEIYIGQNNDMNCYYIGEFIIVEKNDQYEIIKKNENDNGFMNRIFSKMAREFDENLFHHYKNFGQMNGFCYESKKIDQPYIQYFFNEQCRKYTPRSLLDVLKKIATDAKVETFKQLDPVEKRINELKQQWSEELKQEENKIENRRRSVSFNFFKPATILYALLHCQVLKFKIRSLENLRIDLVERKNDFDTILSCKVNVLFRILEKKNLLSIKQLSTEQFPVKTPNTADLGLYRIPKSVFAEQFSNPNEKEKIGVLNHKATNFLNRSVYK